jgi:hypothetical protein
MKSDDEMANTEHLPDSFAVTVVMERQPAKVSTWVDYVWKAVGVTVGNTLDSHDESRVDHLEDGYRLQIYPGYKVSLHIDECDSYYHNLMSPSPRCYIVVRQDDNDEPRPFIVSLSFDEAHAYLEGDDTVFTVDMPAELYRWTESFVLTHYCPQQLKKRKRKDWRKDGSERPAR